MVKQLRAATRTQLKAHAQVELDWQLRVNRALNKGEAKLRDAVKAHRVAQAEFVAQRDAARTEAAERAERVAALSLSLERVRSSRVGGLLQRVSEHEQKIKHLSERRKARQMTVAQANLWKRQAQVAQEKADACQRALGDYCVIDHAQVSIFVCIIFISDKHMGSHGNGYV